MGSVQLAADGRRAAEILAKYFPGTRIANAAGRARTAPTAPAPKAAQAAVPGITLVLPPADEAWRAALVKMIAAGHDALVSTLSLPAPVPLRARFHASAADYQEATELPWFTNGALVSGEMHFLPVDSLEGRGLLERTVRHEIVHALTDRYFVDRPLWVREGAAVYYSVDQKARRDGTAPGMSDRRGHPRRPRRLERSAWPTRRLSRASRGRSRPAAPGSTSDRSPIPVPCSLFPI